MQVQWIVVAGLALPAVLTEEPQGYVASSPEWHERGRGDSPCDALAALASALERRIWRCMHRERSRPQAH